MGAPQGTFIKQSFTATSTGSFSVSDDHGNSFSLSVPIASAGISTSTLVGNSTTAVQETTVAAGPIQLADIKLTFSGYKQFCQPGGVRVEISGTEDWGPSGQGVVKILFSRSAVSFSHYRAWFGNNSGAALGFDWSDSKALNPTYSQGNRSLSWRVGSTFTIDPVTVASSNYQFATGYSQQRKACFANGRYWLFYSDGANLVWRSSPDSITWGTANVVRASIAGQQDSVWCDSSNHLYYAYADFSSSSFQYRYGTLNPDGSISWLIPETSQATTNTHAGSPFISATSTTDVWVVVESGGSHIEAWKYSGTWAKVKDVAETVTSPPAAMLIPLSSSSKKALVYSGNDASTYATIYVTTTSDGGNTWSVAVSPASSYAMFYSAATALGDTLHFAGLYTSGGVRYWNYPLGGSVTAETTLHPADSTSWPVGITTNGAFNLEVTYGSYQGVFYQMSTSSGSVWSGEQALIRSENVVSPTLTSMYGMNGATVGISWTAGSAAPYNVRFASFPIVVPTAATSSNSWSRPGLSPYESYFSHFSDYVSPGNGLVAVEAGTLVLPGRGLSFAPSLVYSQPYAFRSSGSPYQYDNYTGASVGYGWSLNFPWLGTNYLHLSDGQAFPYSWNGNTFQYNGATNFVLTANAGGTYTLTLPSGMVYQFDSSKRLTSITDRTGNNAIAFSYGGNNYVSQVTDTIGRTITFSYNANNQLASIVSGTRTWTLGYTGSQLTSISDPLSRVTTLQYVGTSGANAWLLSAVLWPTGGKVTYAYGSAPVGTEVSTYYATSRNVYYDSTHLSESQSTSYSITNGLVIWSNSTISDGTTTRSYLNHNFQSSKNLMKIYAKDGTGTLQRITEIDSDTSGRANETKTMSPSGSVLVYSISSYDNWGNLIYSKDNIGQQKWFSYANTNSANSFGSSGCTTSFYSQTISSNIHDLMVGSCEYQNGPGTPQQQAYFNYDSNGNRLEDKVSHNGAWLLTDFTHDSYGNTLSVKNANGVYTYLRYSSTYSSAYRTKTSALAGTQNVTTTYTYDTAKGFLLSQTDPNGQTTSYQYDALGRMTLVTYPAVGGLSATKQYSYDDTNNVVAITDENGHVTKGYFDGLARETKIEHWNGSSVYSSESYTFNWVDVVATKTTATGNTYTYSYDWSGRLTKLTNPDTTYETTSYDDVNNLKTVADENGHQRVYALDWNQRLVSVKEYNSSTTYYLTSYSYDLSGSTLAVTDAKGQTTSYLYDDLNRLTRTTFPDTKIETRSYDSVGNLLTRVTANGSTVSYAYDSLKRLTQVTYPGSGGTVTYLHLRPGRLQALHDQPLG